MPAGDVVETEKGLREQLSSTIDSRRRGKMLIHLALFLEEHGQLQKAHDAAKEAVEILDTVGEWSTAPEVQMALAGAEFLEQDYQWRLRHPTPSRLQRAIHRLYNVFLKTIMSVSIMDEGFAP